MTALHSVFWDEATGEVHLRTKPPSRLFRLEGMSEERGQELARFLELPFERSRLIPIKIQGQDES